MSIKLCVLHGTNFCRYNCGILQLYHVHFHPGMQKIIIIDEFTIQVATCTCSNADQYCIISDHALVEIMQLYDVYKYRLDAGTEGSIQDVDVCRKPNKNTHVQTARVFMGFHGDLNLVDPNGSGISNVFRPY